MRHGRRAFLLFAEELFGFTNFGALQMADFGGDLVQRGGDHRQRGHVKSVPVALNDLRRNRGYLQAQPLADFLFVFRLQVGGVADRAGELAHPHLFGGKIEALKIARASPNTSWPASSRR